MPRLRVVAGSSLDDMQPMSVNTGEPFSISTPYFEGQLLAYIKGFPNEDGELLESDYFEREDRAGVTWSIQFQGASPHTSLWRACASCTMETSDMGVQGGFFRRYVRMISCSGIRSRGHYSYRGVHRLR